MLDFGVDHVAPRIAVDMSATALTCLVKEASPDAFY